MRTDGDKPPLCNDSLPCKGAKIAGGNRPEPTEATAEKWHPQGDGGIASLVKGGGKIFDFDGGIALLTFIPLWEQSSHR